MKEMMSKIDGMSRYARGSNIGASAVPNEFDAEHDSESDDQRKQPRVSVNAFDQRDSLNSDRDAQAVSKRNNPFYKKLFKNAVKPKVQQRLTNEQQNNE